MKYYWGENQVHLYSKKESSEEIYWWKYGEKTNNTYMQSNSDTTNSSTAPPYAKFLVINFIWSGKKVKHIAPQEFQLPQNEPI